VFIRAIGIKPSIPGKGTGDDFSVAIAQKNTLWGYSIVPGISGLNQESSQTMKLFKTMLLSGCLMAAGVGCNAGPEAEGSEAEPTQTVGQATTITTTYQLSWPAQTVSNRCGFGDTAAGNQVAINSYASGRLEEAVSLSGLAGRRIVSLKLTSASTSFKYDDILLLNYNTHLLMASDKRAAAYSAGAAPDSVGTTPIAYSWASILNKDISNERAQAAWCVAGTTTCSVPATETQGSLSISIPDFKAMDELVYRDAPDVRTFRLVTIGDNDAVDCMHGALNLQLEVVTEPATPQPFNQFYNVPVDRLTALHSGCTSNSLQLNTGYSKACIAAAHRFCNTKGYEGGMPTEILLPSVGIDCFRAQYYPSVDLSRLTNRNAGCTLNYMLSANDYSKECNSGASRLCRVRGYESGVLQETSNGQMGLACINKPSNDAGYVIVPYATWTPVHAECPTYFHGPNVSKQCASAARNYCRNSVSGATTGFVVEWGPDAGDLACVRR